MKTNTAWTFAGNTVYAACQWVVFVLLVKTLTPEAAGAFAYAIAITGPVFVLASLRLRHLLAAQPERPSDFSGYVFARLITTFGAIGISIAVGAVLSPKAASLAVLTIMALGRACDALSDLCHGLFQRELDMRSAAIGISINGLLSVALVAAAVLGSRSIVLATTAYAAASLCALACWDVPRAVRWRRAEGGDRMAAEPARPRLSAAWRLIRTALPLGVSSAIGSVQTNLPRYVIASYLGAAALARFVAISYITLAGHLVVNAASQAALPLLARDAHDPLGRYRTRLAGLVAGTFVLGAVCLLAAFALGRPVLAFIYGPGYAHDDRVLLWLVAAMVVTFASVFLGAGRVARQRFASQSLTSAMSLAVVAGCIVPLVKRDGLLGAAWSLLAGAVVELCGYVIFTACDLRAAARTVESSTRGPAGRPQRAASSLRVLNVLGRLDRGGAELRMVELAEAFPADRVHSDFLVLTGLGGTLDDRVRSAGGGVIKCRLDLRFPLRFLRVLRVGRYDVVHSHVHYFSGVILTLARLAGVPRRVSHLHTARINDRDETQRRRLQIAACRRLIQWNATDIVAAGEGAMVAAWGPAWPSDRRCRVVYNSVRADRLDIGRDGRAGKPTVVNVASVKPLKNQMRLVGILNRLVVKVPSVQLHIVGNADGPYGEQVRHAAAAAGLSDRLSLVGEVDEAMPWLAAAHLMILPSVWEGLPCAVLEACAVGTPVLASDLPGTREIGRHFPHVHLLSLDEDDEAWAAAAARIIEQGPLDAATAAEWLAKSPFVFDRSRNAHYEIWSGLRASA